VPESDLEDQQNGGVTNGVHDKEHGDRSSGVGMNGNGIHDKPEMDSELDLDRDEEIPARRPVDA